jgi:hypothetical protein
VADSAPRTLDASVFGVLWGIAILLHFAWPGPHIHIEGLTGYLSAGAAALLIARPRWTPAWLLVAVLQWPEVVRTAVGTERLSMSWLIIAITHGVWVGSWLRHRWRTPQELLDAVAPTLRGLVVVVYFYATLHKLNTAYFSAANTKPLRFLNRISPLLDADAFVTAQQASAAGVITEGLIFLFLLIPATRLLAVLLGIGLHFTLGLAGFQQFSIMFPLLLLFGPALPRRAPRWSEWPGALLVVPVALALLTWAEPVMRNATVRDTWWWLLGAAVVWRVGKRVRAFGVVGFGALPPWDWRKQIVPAVFAAWCFVPFLGITSHPCMTMYSSLSVHSGRSNHWFVPAALQIDAIQRDFVRITDSSTSAFPEGQRVPRRGLRKQIRTARLRGKAPARVSWERDGVVKTATDGHLPDPSWLDALPMISWNGPVAVASAKRRARRSKR